jgi:hypothetical protein
MVGVAILGYWFLGNQMVRIVELLQECYRLPDDATQVFSDAATASSGHPKRKPLPVQAAAF